MPRQQYRYEPNRGSPPKQQRNPSPLTHKKIENLHMEFQGLKNKIKEVEERNHIMLNKIRCKPYEYHHDEEDSLEEVVNHFKFPYDQEKE